MELNFRIAKFLQFIFLPELWVDGHGLEVTKNAEKIRENQP
jgi:hypothetical protein